MPRNRADVERDAKQEEILDAASRLFLADGVETTSMTKVASAAGVAKNTVYWYFKDKDALLLAVLGRELRLASGAWEVQAPDLADRMVAVVGLFARIDRLSSAVHARLRTSPLLAEWHARFHAGSDRWLGREIEVHLRSQGQQPLAPEELAAVVRIWTYAIEGLVAHEAPVDEVRRVCRVLVAQLRPTAAS
ncbi:MAG: helix-turn-helix domain-containing protein [Solirubrobacteraceae bacterium]|nr:helix-turn-helix domain-containing protein [Solirubrobacteraceae bacterium]